MQDVQMRGMSRKGGCEDVEASKGKCIEDIEMWVVRSQIRFTCAPIGGIGLNLYRFARTRNYLPAS